MAALDDILGRLEAARGDVRAQAAITAEFAISVQREGIRDRLRAALDAAAVLRWFDAALLAHLLDAGVEEARSLFQTLVTLPFVERFPVREGDVFNLHDATRLGSRRALARDDAPRFRSLAARAAAAFAHDDSSAGRIEWIYHRLCAAPDEAATELEGLDRYWSGSARPEDHQALAIALRELEHTGLVRGRAQVWVLLSVAWVRVSRGEFAEMQSTAVRILELARAARDERAEADAQCLVGDVLQAQGKLGEAQAAFGEYLAISRRLAEADPSNAGWQRGLAVALVRISRLENDPSEHLQKITRLREALTIFDGLVEVSPENVGWRRDRDTVALELRSAELAEMRVIE
jgi:tetratricopeptide (TPR) repeat protein